MRRDECERGANTLMPLSQRDHRKARAMKGVKMFTRRAVSRDFRSLPLGPGCSPAGEERIQLKDIQHDAEAIGGT